jgi:signal transduction histidine kinase
VWDEPRPQHPPARGWRDWALVGVLAPVAVLEAILRPDLPWRVVSVIIVVGLTPTLLWRRSRPLLMVAIAFATTGLTSLLVGGNVPELYTSAYLLLLAYSLFRWGSGREAAIGLAIIFVKVCVLTIPGYLSPGQTVAGFAVLSSVTALGAAFRYRARARMREFEQVKLLERERLARDLHDTVAHHVSAIAIRAQAGLATVALQPDAAADALRLIEAEASQTLAEMRSMVRVLRRDQPAELTPSPRVTDLQQLASRARAGPSVDVATSATSAICRHRSEPRSTASPRSRSPTPDDMPGTPPGSWSVSMRTRRWCTCGSATTATPANCAPERRPDTG